MARIRKSFMNYIDYLVIYSGFALASGNATQILKNDTKKK
jgi:hypothetical protein